MISQPIISKLVFTFSSVPYIIGFVTVLKHSDPCVLATKRICLLIPNLRQNYKGSKDYLTFF